MHRSLNEVISDAQSKHCWCKEDK